MGAYGGLKDSSTRQLAAEKPIIFFSGRKTRTMLYQHSTTAHRSFVEHASICSPTQFAHLHGKPHRFLYRSDRLHGSSNGYASMETDLLFTFISTAEHRIARAILERHHARVTSQFFGPEVFSFVFFKWFLGFTWLVPSYNKYRTAVPTHK